MIDPRELLIQIANSFVGLSESGEDNSGPMVEEFQKAVDGKAEKEAWCLCFAQYCVRKVDEKLKIKTALYPTEHCLTLWNRTNEFYHANKPEAGALMVWHHFKNGVGTGLGHVGIVRKVIDDHWVETIEGNTGNGEGIERNGDGVYCRKRATCGNEHFRVIGYIRAWNFEELRLPWVLERK